MPPDQHIVAQSILPPRPSFYPGKHWCFESASVVIVYTALVDTFVCLRQSAEARCTCGRASMRRHTQTSSRHLKTTTSQVVQGEKHLCMTDIHLALMTQAL